MLKILLDSFMRIRIYQILTIWLILLDLFIRARIDKMYKILNLFRGIRIYQMLKILDFLYEYGLHL